MSIIVENLTKSFPSKNNKKEIKIVLENINFEIKEGEFITLLGPSGCGKTTTLTIIAGFKDKDSGRVIVDGKEVTKPGPDRAFVFQNYALFPWMKVGENIEYPMKVAGVPKIEREKRLKKLLCMAQMEENANYYIHEISGGMKQRVALLRALACEPKIMLMDEPLGAVDFQMRQMLQIQLETMLRANNITALMVSHDVDEAIYLSDRVLVMSRDKGKIIKELKIELPRPRDRKCEEYHGYVNELTDVLKMALGDLIKNKEDQELLEFIQQNEMIKSND